MANKVQSHLTYDRKIPTASTKGFLQAPVALYNWEE